MEINLSYNQLPSQKYLHNSPAKFKAYMGGFGSGKTKWLIREVLRHSVDTSNNYFIIMRRTYPELDDTLIKDFFEECPRELISNYAETKRDLTLINGSMIVFRSFDTIGKIFSYNLGGFAIDQAEELPEEYFLALVSRLRRVNVKSHYGLLSLNPAGHNWVWKRFINDNKDRKVYDYVVAKSDENTYLPEGYVDDLRKLFPERWVKRYIDCKFDEFEGLVYASFGNHNIIHKLPVEPKNAKYVIVSIDLGVDSPSAVLFSYFDVETTHLILFDEIYERSLTIKQISALIKARLNKWGVSSVWKYLIDPDALKRKQGEDKISTAMQDFRLNGIPVIKADNNVDYGILRTNELMMERDEGDKKPVILVYNKLNHWLEEIYDYVYKARKIGSQETDGKNKPLARRDHLMDCTKYTVLALPLSWTREDRSTIMGIWDKHFGDKFGKIKRGKVLTKQNKLVFH